MQAQVLIALDHFRREKVRGHALIVAPESSLHKWVAECKQWTPELSYILYCGSETVFGSSSWQIQVWPVHRLMHYITPFDKATASQTRALTRIQSKRGLLQGTEGVSAVNIEIVAGCIFGHEQVLKMSSGWIVRSMNAYN